MSATPCKTFAAALDAIAKDSATSYADALAKAHVPDTAEDARACVGLAQQLEQLRGAAGGEAVAPDAAQPVAAAPTTTQALAQAKPEPTLVASAETKATKRARARAAARGKRTAPASRAVVEPAAASAEPPARAEPAKPSRKTNITKLDDELRPPE